MLKKRSLFVAMRSSVANREKSSAAENHSRRANFSRAARRDVRRAAAIAVETNMHSFRIHNDGSVTWTPKWTNTLAKPKQQSCKGDTCSNTSTSLTPSRAEKSRARQTQYYALLDKATKFRAAAVLRWWANDSARDRRKTSSSTVSSATRASGDGLPKPASVPTAGAGGASPLTAPCETTPRQDGTPLVSSAHICCMIPHDRQ